MNEFDELLIAAICGLIVGFIAAYFLLPKLLML